MIRHARGTRIFTFLLVAALFAALSPATAFAAVTDDYYPGVALPASPVNGLLGWLWDDYGDPLPGGDDIDIYNLTLAPGDELQLSLSADAWTDFDMYLERPTGAPDETELMASSALYRYPETVSWVVPEGMGGTYYVTLLDALGEQGDYSLTWSKTTDADARLFGSDRTATAAAISRSTFATASTAVLATSGGFADALAASGLCGTLDAPLLLTPQSGLSTDAMTELLRLHPSKVYLIGGTGALSDSIKTEITDLYSELGLGAPAFERLSGLNRFETAAAVASEMASLGADMSNAFIVTGLEFADAVSAAPLAFSQKMPILLSYPEYSSDPTLQAVRGLGITKLYAIGGTGAISDGVLTDIQVETMSYHPVNYERWSGLNRYETSRVVAENGVDAGWATFANVGLATGANFPDALAGGTWSGRNGGVLLLTTPTTLHPEAQALLTQEAVDVERATLFGGTGVLSSAVQTSVHQILSAPLGAVR